MDRLPRHVRCILLSLGAALVLWNSLLLSFGVTRTHLVQIGAPQAANPAALPHPSLRGASSESVAALVRINHELVRELKLRPPAQHSDAHTESLWPNGTAVSAARNPVQVPTLLEPPSATRSVRANASALVPPPSSLLGPVLPQRVLPALVSNASELAPGQHLVDASATGPAYADTPPTLGVAQASGPGWAAPAAAAQSGALLRPAGLPALQAPGLLPPLLTPAAAVGAPPLALAAAAPWTPGGSAAAAPALGALVSPPPVAGLLPLAPAAPRTPGGSAAGAPALGALVPTSPVASLLPLAPASPALNAPASASGGFPLAAARTKQTRSRHTRGSKRGGARG